MSVLLQFGSDPFNSRYEDLEGRSVFSLSLASPSPTLIIRLTREPQWAQQHPGVMGPERSWFYFGPPSGGNLADFRVERVSPGYVVYGNNRISLPMAHLVRQQRAGSTSRYFTAQSGRDYKWRISETRMECLYNRTTLAIWELSHPEDEHHARLTIKPQGLPLITEIITTLILNRMYLELKW
ncbi:hypothetical protein C8J56DRAFT_859705 [Mycena floridula]|nr:hypothetical protein C8J56DRAFT_859705 [Mycena floridula]